MKLRVRYLEQSGVKERGPLIFREFNTEVVGTVRLTENLQHRVLRTRAQSIGSLSNSLIKALGPFEPHPHYELPFGS